MKDGAFKRVRIDGQIKRLDDQDLIPEKTKGRILKVDLVVDRMKIHLESRSRLADSLELAFNEGEEKAFALVENENGEFEESFIAKLCM